MDTLTREVASNAVDYIIDILVDNLNVDNKQGYRVFFKSAKETYMNHYFSNSGQSLTRSAVKGFAISFLDAVIDAMYDDMNNTENQRSLWDETKVFGIKKIKDVVVDKVIDYVCD